METIYCTTRNFIQHQGNVVDLSEYRRKLAMAHETSLAPDYFAQEPQAEPEEQQAAVLHLVLPQENREYARKERRSARRARSAWMMDICASLGVVVMTTAFTLAVIFG